MDEATSGLQPRTSEVLPALPDGSYVLAPRELAGGAEVRMEACLASGEEGGKRMRKRLVLRMRGGADGQAASLQQVEVRTRACSLARTTEKGEWQY